MEIIFTNAIGYAIEEPKPASNFIPEWYKNTKSYTTDEKKPFGDGTVPSTIKRCIPVFDAITSGYIITLPVDIYVSFKTDENGKKGQSFEWPTLQPLGFHPIEQAPEHPQAKPPYAYPKFNNPWAIKTPKGYSTLFVQPFHRESLFTILPGIVDTDMYTAPVNFPFVINDPNFEGYIKQGTPIAQVIPIKRDGWSMKIGNEKNFLEQKEISDRVFLRFFDKYKSMFWNKKEYK
jgi:hypothetical protein